jgi:hypothetical protein
MRTESDNYTLIIRVFHKRGFISTDEMLGIVRVPLVTIDGSGEEADSWYDLSMEGTRLKNTSGQVFIAIIACMLRTLIDLQSLRRSI